MRRARSLLLAGGALLAILALGCESLRDALDGAHERRVVDVPTLRAPAGPAEGDLDLHHEWRAARVRQQVAERHRDWAFRPFTEFVVLNGVGHRALLLLPSQHAEVSTASFKIAVPAGSDAELVAWVALFPKFAADSDGVEAGWGVGDAADPEALPLHFERLAGGQAPADWREVRIDLAPHRGKTVWIVLASRDRGGRHADWLLWGDPRVQAKRPAPPIRLDLGNPAGLVRRPRAVPWSAATVFKTYSLFSAVGAHYGEVGWLRAAYPWLDSLRFLSALGGNHGPTLAREDAAKAAQEKEKPSFEVEVAGRYEFFRDGLGAAPGPVASQFDWKDFDALNASAAASGLDLLFNLAGAPERFTGGTGHYPTYRFNELPITDEAGWREYVATLFGHLATQPWYGRAAFSFFSEPNCVWVEADGTVKKVGFQGDAAAYARQYLWTWRAMAPVVGAAPVHLGPWVVETARSSSAADNLGAYLRAIVEAFAAAGEPLPPWSRFAFNLYETPHLTLDNFTADKIVHARQVLGEVLGRADLPIVIEELGIHPLVSQAFQDATQVQLGTTHWEMAWHAEIAALLLEQDITQAASWYPILMLYPAKQSLRAYASYLFASIVVGSVEWAATNEDTLALARRAAPLGAGDVGIRLGSRHTDRVGMLVADDTGRSSHRIAVWSYPRYLATDARVATGASPELVEIALPPRADGAWRVRILGYEDDVPLAATGVALRHLTLPTFAGLPRFALRELVATDRLRLTVAPGALYLIIVE